MIESPPVCYLRGYKNELANLRKRPKGCAKVYFRQEAKKFAKFAGTDYPTAVRVILCEHKVQYDRDDVYVYF
jgi:hypothetical protein